MNRIDLFTRMFSPLVLLRVYSMQMLNTSNVVHKSLSACQQILQGNLPDPNGIVRAKGATGSKKAAKSSDACALRALSCTTLHNTHTLYSVDLDDNNIIPNNANTYCTLSVHMMQHYMYEIQLNTFSTVLKWPFDCQRL